MTLEEKKVIISKFFAELTFEEKEHKYLVNGWPLSISVSGLIKKFVKEVDFDMIATRKDMKMKLPVGTHKRLWGNKGNTACAMGDRAHFFGEIYAFHRNIDPTTGFEVAITKFWNELPDHIVPVFTELQMFHLKEMFGGTADIILYNLKTEKFIIGDYKTNEDIFKNFNEKKLLTPFNHLLESSYNKYQLQFSYYQILFEQTGFEVEKRVLIWLKPDGEYSLYYTEDFREQLLKTL